MKVLLGSLGLFLPSIAFAGSASFLGPSVQSLHFEQLPVASHSNYLIGATSADRDEFPGVFYTRQGNSRCTGTVIGQSVVATAAHCVANGGSLSITYKEKRYSGTCTHSNLYRGNATADWALCRLTTPLPDPIAETINTNADFLATGTDLILMGYGCTFPGGSGGNDGTLRIGQAPIIRLPSYSNYDIVTRGSSALCFGDSGGPSFYVDSETGRRYQTGINSRGDIRSTSYLSALHTDAAMSFYRDWSSNQGVTICGLHDDAEGCRQGDYEPLPEACQLVVAEDSIATLDTCTTKSAEPDLAVCDRAQEVVSMCLDARR